MFYEPGTPDVFRYEDVDDPAVGPQDVLIKVTAVGVQGGDVLRRAHGPLPRVPHIVGYQASGVVVSVGEAVMGFAPGHRVVATMDSGSHAELASVPAACVWLVPDGLSLEAAAAVPIEYGTADDCLFEFGHLESGETVLVQAGAGGVGIAAIQLAKAAGATVFATASSDERLGRLTEFGLDAGINYASADVVRTVRQLTDGRGVDLVVDPVGGATLETSIAALAYRGRISWIGRAGRDDKVPEVWPLMEKNASLTALSKQDPTRPIDCRTPIRSHRFVNSFAV